MIGLALCVISPSVRASEPAPRPLGTGKAALVRRTPFEKPSPGSIIGGVTSRSSGLVKFAEGTGVRLRGGAFTVDPASLDLGLAARQNLTRASIETQIAATNQLLRSRHASVTRLFSRAEDALAAEHRAGETNSGKELADLNLFYEIRFGENATAVDVADTLYQLNMLDLVEFASPNSVAAPPPAADLSPTTPNFGAYLTYFAPAPNGLDVNYGRPLTGGRGESVRVVDVEQGWTVDHEDWPGYLALSGNNYAPALDHGTAVIGEIAAAENAYGMTGVAPSVEISLASPVLGVNNDYYLADAVNRAYAQSRSGDVINLEQQVYYNYPSDLSLCPPEWDNATFSAVATAVANGRIVVETVGNGRPIGNNQFVGQDLDDTVRFGSRFVRAVSDTGAIYVAAGIPASHAPEAYSNFGSRVDVQGWGEGVATLGYGDLFFPNQDVRQAYTTSFSGTSSAAPMVSGAVAIVQGIRRGRGLTDLSSQDMRTALLIGATPQTGGSHIGPLPNLRGIIQAIPITAPSITATGTAAGVTVTWSAVAGASGYQIFRQDSAGGAWNLLNSTSSTQYSDAPAAGHTFLYRVRAYDALQNQSTDSNYDLATTISFDDPQLNNTIMVRAQHIVQVRIAINDVCTFAGTAICPSLPYNAAAIDASQVRGMTITESDFRSARNTIVSLRSSIGASPASFTDLPVQGGPIRAVHMKELRTAAN